MPLFDKPFAIQIPVQLENLTFLFYVNQNLYIINSECKSVPHNHHDYELRYIASGIGNQIIEEERYTLSQGNCLVTQPFEYHWQEWLPNTPSSEQYNVRFSIKKPSQNHPRAFALYDKFINFIKQVRIIQDEQNKMLAYFEILSRELYEKREGFMHAAKTLCALIMTEVIRHVDKNADFFIAEEQKYRNHQRSRVDHFFLARYLTDVKVGDLAEEMNVSVRQVGYTLHRLYGMSFVQKLTEMRLQHAAMLLQTTDLPIQEVCRNSGFQNHNYFARCFQKAYEKTPSEYRKVK